jgi:putative ABC transport system permease protein
MRKPLSAEDAEFIRQACPAVKTVATNLFVFGAHQVRYRDETVQPVEFRGTTPEFVEVYGNATMKEGRFFTASENLHRRNVVVLGEDVAKALFPAGDALGQEVLVNGSAFVVVGVFQKPKGGFGEGDEDRRVMIPFQTLKKMYPAAEEVGFRILAYPGQLTQAVDQVREVLRRRRNVGYNEPDNFAITTAEQAIEQFRNIVGGIAVTVVVLSSVGLLVGGVGVMNIMLVSVTERTREIGVRKAIGARRRDITWQFLLEAMTLTSLGGGLGIALAAAIIGIIRAATTIAATVPLWAVLVGLGVSASVGLIFGVWPAVKAARLDPVEALRYE